MPSGFGWNPIYFDAFPVGLMAQSRGGGNTPIENYVYSNMIDFHVCTKWWNASLLVLEWFLGLPSQ